jgi:outer membrane cobalamin receptor
VNLTAQYALRSLVLTGSVQNALNDPSQEIPGFRPLGRTVMFGARYEVEL